jgi:hypothetical protein
VVVETVITQGSIHVFTFKRGLLSSVAHDLRLHLDGFSIQIRDHCVRAVFQTASLTVDGVIRRDLLDARVLSERERAEIQTNLRSTVLKTHRFPEAVLLGQVRAAASGWIFDATLELTGVVQPLTVRVRADGSRMQGEIELVPSRWGIQPYKALLGAIQLQDRVKIVFDFPATSSLP